MSIHGEREYRPRLHFTPRTIWMNDPNGLFFINGEYHMFFQYNPQNTQWGPMHWGHAVSSDLTHWRELPIALYPDSSGTAFSGCAVIDTQNTSGFSDRTDAVILIYTRDSPEGQKQCLSYSYDNLNFYHFQNNPVISNPGIANFRDPKVFWHQHTGQWVMVLAVKTELWLYGSPDLLSWELLSRFHDETLGESICWECPDLFPLPGPDGAEHWILTSSIILSDTPKYRVISYIGAFDGQRFIPQVPFQLMDHGLDYYAAVTFWGDDCHTTIGWFSNWTYAADLPTGGYCGIMSLPRIPKLVERQGLLKLIYQIHPLVRACFGASYMIAGHTELTTETFYLDIRCTGDFSLKLENKRQEFLELGLKNNTYYIDRSVSGSPRLSPWHSIDSMKTVYARRTSELDAHIEFIFDCCCGELFCDDEGLNFSMLCFPTTPYSHLSWEGDLEVTLSPLL